MKVRIAGILIFTSFLFSCSHQNRFHRESFNNPVQIEIQRFDLDFMKLDTANIETGLKQLANKYPDFYPFFISEILRLNPEDTTQNSALIRNFLSDSVYINVHQKIKDICGDLSTENNNLTEAFNYIHFYFPEIKLPEIYAFTSGFNHQIISNENMVCIGTDFYLGSNFELYPDVSHDYLIKNYRREMVDTDILNEVLHSKFNYGNVPVNLLGSMIYEGKIMYLMEIFLSGKTEESLIGYSPEENEWFKKHQKHIWTMILEEKNLFTSDLSLISKFTQAAPFTAPVSQESPGKLGVRLGWEIVRAYMKNNPETTLPELMQNTRYQSILEQSDYRP
jgi:hypothetical protein